MDRDYESKEIREIIGNLTSLPDYQGYKYDSEVGFTKGPCSGPEFSNDISYKQAVIGIRQPIAKFAQRHLLLIEKDNRDRWRVKNTLKVTEG